MTSLHLDATRASWAIVAAGLCGLIAVAHAASPTFWLVSTQEDFLLGESDFDLLSVELLLLESPEEELFSWAFLSFAAPFL